jgi:hypothetical protein
MYGGFLLTMGMVGVTTTLLAPSLPEGPYLFAGKEIDGGTTPLRIGASGDGIGYFKGAIDEVRIYDRALASEEIQADMERPIGVLSRTPSAGLIAAYGFEEENGNRILDASDQGNHGLLDGASRTAGRFGRALVFSGHSDQVIIPHAPILDLRTHFTLEAWVRPEIILNGCPTVIQKGGDHYFLYTGPDLVPGGGGTFGGSIEGVLAPEALPEGVWSYLALTYDGSGLRIYINGHHRASVVRWFQGRIDEMFVGSIAVHPGLVADNPSLKHVLETGEPIRLRGMTGPARSDEGTLLDIQTRRRTPILRLTAQGDDLVLRYLTVAAALGLPSPEVRISGALRNAGLASPLQVELSGTSSGRSLSVNGVAHHGLGFTLGMGWTVLLYSEYLPPWLREFFNLVWMASWAFLVGFWSQMHRASVGVIVIFGSGLWLLPATGVLVPTPPAQWAAAVLGFLTGFGVRLKIGGQRFPQRDSANV